MIKTKRYPKLMKIQMRIKKGHPGQGQKDKQNDKKLLTIMILKKGYTKLRKNQGRIKKGYPGQGQKDKQNDKQTFNSDPILWLKDSHNSTLFM